MAFPSVKFPSILKGRDEEVPEPVIFNVYPDDCKSNVSPVVTSILSTVTELPKSISFGASIFNLPRSCLEELLSISDDGETA